MNAGLIEAVPRAAVPIVVEEFQVAVDAVVDRVVLAGHGVHAIDVDLLQQLARLPELLGFGQVAHVACVYDERGRMRQRVDVRDRAAQAAYDVGIRFLAKADVRIAYLHERKLGLRHRAWRANVGCCDRARHAADDGPDNGGAAPCGETAKRAAARGVFDRTDGIIGAHREAPRVGGRHESPIHIAASLHLFPRRAARLRATACRLRMRDAGRTRRERRR